MLPWAPMRLAQPLLTMCLPLRVSLLVTTQRLCLETPLSRDHPWPPSLVRPRASVMLRFSSPKSTTSPSPAWILLTRKMLDAAPLSTLSLCLSVKAARTPRSRSPSTKSSVPAFSTFMGRTQPPKSIPGCRRPSS
ncbi:hypothetical protein IWX49DRAFT_573759 [Phyllosticta citricarpa]